LQSEKKFDVLIAIICEIAGNDIATHAITQGKQL
jgi:hypothetical protein